MRAALLHGMWAAAVFAALGIGLAGGQEWTARKYELMIASLEDIHRVRDDLQAERCRELMDATVYAVLTQVDMTCFGRWHTADGEIILSPVAEKRRAE